MRKMLGWLAFIVLILAAFILAMTIFMWTTDVVNMPKILVKHRMEWVFGTTFLIMFPLASKVRRGIAGTPAKPEAASLPE